MSISTPYGIIIAKPLLNVPLNTNPTNQTTIQLPDMVHFLTLQLSWICKHVFICVCFVENKWANIDVIYYEYGALVLVYSNSERATRSFNILQDAMFDSKPLLVLLLPNIQVSLQCIGNCAESLILQSPFCI